ncbi:S26 family signal peptidase [Neorhodopirellula pilleata]|uniref:Signal peptidase I n=1 Tax=Neorhodopirellula pilleata TaxID=2714738 RepID=A0A5C5ZKK1_9BACT|nr:S26 family signal peptidase [Neorhodopirellula pilleata]TWT87760.1 Signal peptidase I [Neorhodopirellula pilleata]
MPEPAATSDSESTAAESSDSPESNEPTAQEAWDSLSVTQQRAAVFRVQAGRETAEAFVVAFVLALLFRAFIAEAFVIPTGSMAPALMGAHKDVFCQQCGEQFPVGASLENRDVNIENVVVGGICPNCRFTNPMDLAATPDHGTFSGDRILVSKFAYAVSDPDRWDVIVFKVPVNPKQNYIKRLVGLPNETLSILHGDVYARPTDSAGDSENQPITSPPFNNLGEILRKPPSTLMAMKHVVYDSDHQSSAILKSGFPARLQPWRPGVSEPPSDSWQIQRSDLGLIAELPESAAKSGEANWLRYYHHWPTDEQWAKAVSGLSLAAVDPYSSRLITDFHAYDAYLYVDADRVYDLKPSPARVSRVQRLLGRTHDQGVFRPDYESGGDLEQFGRYLNYGNSGFANEGVHWVGDLIVQTEVETSADAKALTLEIVEAGVRYQCQFDLASGKVSLAISDGKSRPFDGDDGPEALSPQADTGVRAGGQHSIRFSNCDNQLLVWVDGEVIEFDRPTTFNVASFLPFDEVAPVYNGPGDPGDASPVGLTVDGGSAIVRRLTIDRDKYYIATDGSTQMMLDYDMNRLSDFAGGMVREDELQAVMGEPTVWKDFPGWGFRKRVSFPLGEDQFFPMGDNSPESLDARCWAGTKEKYGRGRSVDENAYRFANASYVPRDLLVGKALAIFWPHPWRSPLPFTPNVERMRLIR